MATRFRLRDALGRAGIGQSELSRRTGVSFATINRMCTNATRGVDLETLDRLSAALGCQPGDLLERAPDKAPRGKRGKASR